MEVGVSEQLINHRHPLEIVADLVFHGQPHATVQLNGLLADESAGAAYLDLGARNCQSARKIGSDAISMMFTAAQVAPINLA